MAQMKNGPARVLVADSMSDVAAQIMRKAGLDVDVNTGLSEDELVDIINDYDALLVRSSTTVTQRILAVAGKLKIVGRAGVGVDNVDIEAASRRGVIVMNTPLGNITSAAEHAWALLVALARNVAAADAALKAGRWDKKKFIGVELNGKTLGIIGMGKVGQIVARAALGVGMKIVAYDPFLPEKRARELNVDLAELHSVLAQADFLTIHTPLTDKTRNLISAEAIAQMKDGARLVNCARGGIVDEAALIKALEEGKLAGAAMDVFATEPLSEDDPLRKAPNIILTPHLGASTAEAQVKVAEAIARQTVAFLVDGKIRNALNMGVALTPELEPFGDLASRLGQILAQLVTAPPESVRCIVRGRLAEGDVSGLTVSALQGLLMNWQDSTVNMVNAPLLAEERGLSITEEKSGDTAGYINLIRLVAVTDKGEHSVAGTVFEGREQRVVELEGYEMEIRPRGTILIMKYPDRPGMIGKFGTILGDAGINIASMDVGRQEKHGQACVALSLDDSVPADVLATVLAATVGGSVSLVEI